MSDFRELLDMYDIEPGIGDIDMLLDAIERECEEAELEEE